MLRNINKFFYLINRFKHTRACCKPKNYITVTSTPCFLCYESCLRLIDLLSYQSLQQLFPFRFLTWALVRGILSTFNIIGSISNLQTVVSDPMPHIPSITQDFPGGQIYPLQSVRRLHVLVNAMGSGWVGDYAPAPPTQRQPGARQKKTSKQNRGVGALVT